MLWCHVIVTITVTIIVTITVINYSYYNNRILNMINNYYNIIVYYIKIYKKYTQSALVNIEIIIIEIYTMT